GIRDRNVTGVQTCALPILNSRKKYTDIQELDATILREFISKIYVSAYDRKSKTREIQIVYNFIGAFDFDRAKLNTKNKSNNTSNLGNEVDIKAESGAA